MRFRVSFFVLCLFPPSLLCLGSCLLSRYPWISGWYMLPTPVARPGVVHSSVGRVFIKFQIRRPTERAVPHCWSRGLSGPSVCVRFTSEWLILASAQRFRSRSLVLRDPRLHQHRREVSTLAGFPGSGGGIFYLPNNATWCPFASLHSTPFRVRDSTFRGSTRRRLSVIGYQVRSFNLGGQQSGRGHNVGTGSIVMIGKSFCIVSEPLSMAFPI
jgi:hypothetical protein